MLKAKILSFYESRFCLFSTVLKIGQVKLFQIIDQNSQLLPINQKSPGLLLPLTEIIAYLYTIGRGFKRQLIFDLKDKLCTLSISKKIIKISSAYWGSSHFPLISMYDKQIISIKSLTCLDFFHQRFVWFVVFFGKTS